MEVYSLYELNNYIKQVFALNFADTFWITCEISQVSINRGNAYLQLIDKDDTQTIKAASNAAIWFKELSFIQKKLGVLTDQILQSGMSVKLKVEVDYHERYGVKLFIKDIDPSFTYGQLAIERDKIIQRLKEEALLDVNKQLAFPIVMRRIAVISSSTAAGYQDLCQHLKNNEYGYYFDIQLFPAAMQGERVEMEVINQLREIKETNDWDVVIITRGGGSKIDLAWFDSYALAKEIAHMNVPVITGIGHEIDESIADLVSNLALKTPTAVANFIVDHNGQFESSILDLHIKIKDCTKNKLHDTKLNLTKIQNNLHISSQKTIQKYQFDIQSLQYKLQQLTHQILTNHQQSIFQIESYLNAITPQKILDKGYAFITKDGKSLASIQDIKIKDTLNIHLADGELEVQVKDIKN